LLPDGRVLLIGGWGAGKSLASGEIFDPLGECFIPLASPMRYERRLHTATLLDAGHVLIAGGASDQEVLATAEIFKIPPRGKGCKK
ncbi:MAG TPA: kelch domain-containing protein, partial [Nitrospinae bacterium]|nr:kelch domain-containing protein [Nitrospinota bacterium]